MTEYELEFAERLKDTLADNNMKQAQLVQITGISRPTISDYINRKKTPSLDNACKIAKALGVPLDRLCGLKIIKIQTNKNVDMLMYIADIIEDNDGIWKMAVDIVEEFDNEERLVYGEHYDAAICVKDYRFRNFVIEYQQAIKAGISAIREYKLDKKIAESMKKGVLDKYIKIFEEKRSDIE